MVLQQPIELCRTVNSVAMSADCRQALRDDLLDLSRLINERMCHGDMCPYITGAPGSGVPVSQQSSSHVVFVGIDTASLDAAVSFDLDSFTVCHVSQF